MHEDLKIVLNRVPTNKEERAELLAVVLIGFGLNINQDTFHCLEYAGYNSLYRGGQFQNEYFILAGPLMFCNFKSGSNLTFKDRNGRRDFLNITCDRDFRIIYLFECGSRFKFECGKEIFIDYDSGGL